MKTKLDHLVVAAAGLDEGVSYVRDVLGVDIPYGGEHPLMGTHNHLMQIGTDIFIEVISPNPNAVRPQHPCWFGFDDPLVQKSLATGPRLLTWVVNSEDIEVSLGRAAMACGQATQLRRGNLEWLFGLPADGRLLASGMLPYIIQWQTEKHPASAMADAGCVLEKLEIYHPKAKWLQGMLESIGFSLGTQVRLLHGEVGLKASFHTPAGRKILL